MNALKPLFVLFAAVALGGPAAAQDIPATTADGLERRQVPDVDVAYVRPGADLSEYDRVLMGPVSVSFRRNFERDAAPGPNKRISEADLQGIRQRLGTLLHEEVVRELTGAGYELSQVAGPDVMQLDLRVNDLYLSAPPQRQGADEVMAFSTGEMILVAEVSDSISGETVGRIYNRAAGRETHQMHRISRSENETEARKIAAWWAKLIRLKLDAARAKPAG